MKDTLTYESEIKNTLEYILQHHHNIKEIKFFIERATNYFNIKHMSEKRPRVVVLGNSVPEELILATGETPHYILGGSLGSLRWSDDFVPRDTDSVNRSILGFLLNPELRNTYEKALIIVPATCDAMRKIAYMLKEEGFKVTTLDLPPEKENPLSHERWFMENLRLKKELEVHLDSRIKKNDIIDAALLTNRTRVAMSEFIKLSEGREKLIPDALRMLILNCYYYGDITAYAYALELLNKRIMDNLAGNIIPPKPGVLLMGSPVIFPNYKIPQLIQETGLSINSTLDWMHFPGKIIDFASTGTLKKALRAITDARYDADISASFVINHKLPQQLQHKIWLGQIEGVIFHVLKGQIEYDFELPWFEKIFEEYNIPVFRLETDYQYNDVEQLRVRMEAFQEMLVQNRLTRQQVQEGDFC